MQFRQNAEYGKTVYYKLTVSCFSSLFRFLLLKKILLRQPLVGHDVALWLLSVAEIYPVISAPPHRSCASRHSRKSRHSRAGGNPLFPRFLLFDFNNSHYQ
jgi:hypothetical protein